MEKDQWIDDRDHPLPTALAALATRDGRAEAGRFLADGIRNVCAAADAGWPLDELVVSPPLLRSRAGRRVADYLAHERAVPVSRVTPRCFRRLGQTPRASGLMAVARICEDTTPRRRRPKRGPGLRRVWLVMGSVRSPGNLGTLLRTGAALGIEGVIALGPRLDPWDPAVVRASMGALFGLRICRLPHHRALAHWAKRTGTRLVAADGDARQVHVRARMQAPLALLLGDERRGLSRADRRVAHDTVALPIAGAVDSLNVGVAGSVLLYEVWRQTRL